MSEEASTETAPGETATAEPASAEPAAEGSADPKAGSSSTTANGAEPTSSKGEAGSPAGTSSPAAKPVDVGAVLEAAAIADRASRARLAEADRKDKDVGEREAKVARVLKAFEHMSKGEKKAAIKELFGDGYKAAELVEELAMDVEVADDRPVLDVVRAELDQRKAAETADATAKALAATEKAKTDREAEKVAAKEEYVSETFAHLKATAASAEHPHLHAYRDEVTPALILAKMEELVKTGVNGGKVVEPDSPELAGALEKHFQAKQEKIDRRLGRIKDPEPSVEEDIDQALERMDKDRRAREAAERPALMRKDPSIPIGTPVPHGQTGRSALDEILEKLERQDIEAASQLSNGYNT